MNKTVTVDKAISKGHIMVNFPVMVIMFGIIGLTLYLGVQKLIPTWGFPVGFVFAFVFSWLCWSFMITKWRIWAFENVRNVHELKKRAIQEKLIWADGNIFEKTEIRTAADKEKLNSLKDKFLQDDLFEDDLTVGNETIIYYSKAGNFLEMLIMLVCLGFGIYVLLKTDSYIFGSILSIVGAYFSFKEYKQATNKEPQIIINDKGIKTISTKFYNWKNIKNAEVISENYGRDVHFYLIYDHPNGSERLQIDDYDTDQRSLNKLLILYSGRSKNNKTNR